MRRTMVDDSFAGTGGGGWLPFNLNTVPVVKAVLIASTVAFLTSFFSGVTVGAPWREWLIVSMAGRDDLTWLMRPWTWFTYPVMVGDFLSLILGGFWFYVCGGVLERSWGSRNFAVLLAAFSVITVLGLILGAAIFGGPPIVVSGLWLPTSALLVAWAAMDPDQELRIWGCIPVKLKLLALIDVLIIYFTYAASLRLWGPVFGLFALAGCAAAFLYVRKLPRLNLSFELPHRASPQPVRQSYLRNPEESRERVTGFDPLRKRREQEEIARLRRLLGEDDDDRPAARR